MNLLTKIWHSAQGSLLLTSIFILIQFSMFGQNIGAMEVDDEDVSPWIESDLCKYEGIYHFGEGDGSHLLVIVNDSHITVQIFQSAYWLGGIAVESGIADTSELDIKWEYKTLSGLRIVNGKFYSDQYLGEFVNYSDSVKQYRGLKIYNSWNKWTGKGRYDIGLRYSTSFTDWFKGKYPECSYRYLTSSELDTLSCATLEIMRNEIFARYHFTFIAGHEMDSYFRRQGWYWPRYKNVNLFLTDIELVNIALIKEISRQKLVKMTFE